MVASYQQNASVEGRSLKLQTRKFHSILPKRVAGSVRFGFKLGMNSFAELTKSYENPVESVIYTTSMVEVGDSINGAVISGWSAKPHAEPYVSKGSGTHSATFCNVNSDCFAILDQCAREHYNDAEFMKKYPPIELKEREIIATPAA